jgi:CheY-like chemotaxis protein
MPNTVLVVDDDPVVHRVMRHYLTRAGYEVATANDGQEAVEVAARDIPQVIIMDVAMPKVNGLEALRRLKSSEVTQAIPVIVLSSNPQRANQMESEASGASFFLTKPFTQTELLAALRHVTVQPTDKASSAPPSV